ncbi:MAG: prepilin-type N-terminal cleavage/methylation domain-containing protein [Candidatus Komeilibacteria bacterium]|nr:prepilin-type N-terminal cleavage/methylation domain-containing protein [Candidatus Komeilibacteria bacterium]
MKLSTQSNGFSLIELIIAIGIFVALIAGVTFFIGGPFSGSSNSREMERFGREGLEALEIIKERSWTQLDDNDDGSNKKTYRDSNGDWVIASGTETRGSFTRAIAITTVQRNSSGVIVSSGGTDDPSTKKIVVTISATGVADYVLETYVTNWEAYRMSQTDWSGTTGTNIWTSGTNNYYSSTTMNGMTVTGELKLASST